MKIGAKVVAHGRYRSSRWPRSPCRRSCFGASSIASAGCDRRTGPMLTLDGRGAGESGGRGAHTPQTSLRTSSIVKPRKVSLTAFPRPAMMSAIFATVSSSGASVIAIWSY